MALALDLAPHLAAFGDDITLDGAAVRAIFDTEAVDAFGELITQEPSVLLSAAGAATAAPGQAVVRAGVTYTVRQVLPEPPDGGTVRLVLARA